MNNVEVQQPLNPADCMDQFSSRFDCLGFSFSLTTCYEFSIIFKSQDSASQVSAKISFSIFQSEFMTVFCALATWYINCFICKAFGINWPQICIQTLHMYLAVNNTAKWCRNLCRHRLCHPKLTGYSWTTIGFAYVECHPNLIVFSLPQIFLLILTQFEYNQKSLQIFISEKLCFTSGWHPKQLTFATVNLICILHLQNTDAHN